MQSAPIAVNQVPPLLPSCAVMRCGQLNFILLLGVLHTMAWKFHVEARPPILGGKPSYLFLYAGQITSSMHVKLATEQGVAELGGRMLGEDGEEAYVVGGGVGTLGSRPPSCMRKCGGCVPCAAIQVPTIAGRLRTHYANYEPEGWKCKCGSTIYNP